MIMRVAYVVRNTQIYFMLILKSIRIGSAVVYVLIEGFVKHLNNISPTPICFF